MVQYEFDPWPTNFIHARCSARWLRAQDVLYLVVSTFWLLIYKKNCDIQKILVVVVWKHRFKGSCNIRTKWHKFHLRPLYGPGIFTNAIFLHIHPHQVWEYYVGNVGYPTGDRIFKSLITYVISKRREHPWDIRRCYVVCYSTTAINCWSFCGLPDNALDTQLKRGINAINTHTKNLLRVRW